LPLTYVHVAMQHTYLLRGHYNYYGITFNGKGVGSFYEQVKQILYKWLNRRGGKPS